MQAWKKNESKSKKYQCFKRKTGFMFITNKKVSVLKIKKGVLSVEIFEKGYFYVLDQMLGLSLSCSLPGGGGDSGIFKWGRGRCMLL